MSDAKVREAAERAADSSIPSHLWDGFVAGYLRGHAEGRAPLVALLREVEWGALPWTDTSPCPWCLSVKYSGHAADCNLAAATAAEPAT